MQTFGKTFTGKLPWRTTSWTERRLGRSKQGRSDETTPA